MKTYRQILAETRSGTGPLLPFNTQMAKRGIQGIYNPIRDVAAGPYTAVARNLRPLPKQTPQPPAPRGMLSRAFDVATKWKSIKKIVKYTVGGGLIADVATGGYFDKTWEAVMWLVNKSTRWARELGPDWVPDWFYDHIFLIVTVSAAAGIAFRPGSVLYRAVRKMLRNRDTVREITEALDVGNHELARMVMFNALANEGADMTVIRDSLSEREYRMLIA